MRRNRALLLFPALLVLLALILAGCKDFSFFGVLGDRINESSLLISPSTISVIEGGTLTFTATGGKPPYGFSVVSGVGSIGASTGVFTAATAGTVTVRVTDAIGRSSDAAVTVTGSGVILAISPDSVSMGPGGSLTFVASGGTPPYTFSLTASGSGSPTINAGSGAYAAGASLGADTIQVQDAALATAAATVNVTAAMVTVDYSLDEASFSLPASGTAGSALSAGATFRIQNALAAGGSGPISWWVFLSDDGTLGSGDYLLDAGSVGFLAAGASADVGFSGTWPLSSGAKTLFVMIAAADDLNFANNISSGSAVTLAPPDINYEVSAVTLAMGTTAGGALNGAFDLANIGTSDGSQPVGWTVYVSTDVNWDALDPVVDAGVMPALDVGFPQPGIAFEGTWPAAPGTYYVIVKVAASDEPPPNNTAGNTAASTSVAVEEAPINYEAISVTSAGTTAGGAVSGTFEVRNHGTANGGEDVFWTVYASPGNDTLELGTDTVVDAGVVSPPPTTTVPRSVIYSGRWPATPGPYFLLVKVSSSDEPAVNTSDNLGKFPVTTDVPDYDVQLVSSPTGSTATGGTFSASFTLRNQAPVAGSKDVTWTAYASHNDTLELGTDVIVDAGTYALPRLGPPPAPSQTTSISIGGTWPADAGDYYLIVQVAASDELVTADNLGATSTWVTITDQFVDYTVTDVNNMGGVMAGGNLTGNFSLKNVGAVNGSQTVYYQVYASNGDDFLDTGDTLVASGSRALLNAGVEVTGIGFSGNWPGITGLCYLIVVVTALDDAKSDNNVVPLPAVEAVTLVTPGVDYAVNAGSMNVTLSVLPPEVKAQAVPAGSVSGTFQYSNGLGPGNGVAWLSYAVYASTDNSLSGDDLLVASGSAPPLALGQNGTIPFNGAWPLAYGSYYLIARVVSSEDSLSGNNWASSSTMTAVGIYDEPLTDPPIVTVPPLGNGEYGLIAPCNLNVTFRPGLSVRINGSFSNSDKDDIFAFNTGTANTLTFHMTWGGNQDVQFNPMTGASLWLSGVYVSNYDHITWVWTPDVAGGVNRWWDIQNGLTGPPPTAPKNIGAYILTITAN